MKLYHKNNFHKHTFCVFKEVELETINNLIPNYSSKSGSQYYFVEEGLYRVSNHWGRAANCRWKLDSSTMKTTSSKNNSSKIGYANWSDFYPNNEQENLFYIQVDFATKTVDFLHKDNPKYDGKSVCRNASETAKRIKVCKEVLLEDKWCNYLVYDDLNKLKKEVIHELIYTNTTFITIKQNYLK
ncbi:hypothetical protein [uncultured Flavobacterium sp.]|uniref:hypothetical protein n=1 Tax=uncultured Flavobacterium sp. TaxID=165435 RepID=UPI0030C8BEBF